MRMLVRYGLLMGVVCALAGAALHVVSRSAGTPASEIPSAASASASAAPAKAAPESIPAPKPATRDERYRELVQGTWEDDYQGKRTMILKEDGTGTMIVELSGVKAALFASRLQFDMVWSVDSGRLRKRTIGGQPETRVNMILKMMGDRVDEPILELTRDRLLLLDKDGETRYDWRRKK